MAFFPAKNSHQREADRNIIIQDKGFIKEEPELDKLSWL